MKTNKEDDPIEVFAGTIWQVAIVKSLLENAEVEAFLKDEINGTLVPWIASSGGAGSVKVVVALKDSEKAKLIIDDYEKNLKDNG